MPLIWLFSQSKLPEATGKMIRTDQDSLDPGRAELDANGSPALDYGLANGVLIGIHAGASPFRQSHFVSDFDHFAPDGLDQGGKVLIIMGRIEFDLQVRFADQPVETFKWPIKRQVLKSRHLILGYRIWRIR